MIRDLHIQEHQKNKQIAVKHENHENVMEEILAKKRISFENEHKEIFR